MTRRPDRVVLMLGAALLLAACADRASGPDRTHDDGGILLASGSGSDGDGSGGGGGGGGDGGGGDPPPPATGTGTVQVIQGGTGHGRTTSQPAGIDCTVGPEGPTGLCSAVFPAGTRVKLDARAAANSSFKGWPWVTSCPKAPEVTVQAGATHNCRPVFELRDPATFLLQVEHLGSGTSTSSPSGISCTSDADAGTLTGSCAANYTGGTVVTLTATPTAGWTFSGWSGDDADCGDGRVTMFNAKRCTATFTRN